MECKLPFAIAPKQEYTTESWLLLLLRKVRKHQSQITVNMRANAYFLQKIKNEAFQKNTLYINTHDHIKYVHHIQKSLFKI